MVRLVFPFSFLLQEMNQSEKPPPLHGITVELVQAGLQAKDELLALPGAIPGYKDYRSFTKTKMQDLLVRLMDVSGVYETKAEIELNGSIVLRYAGQEHAVSLFEDRVEGVPETKEAQMIVKETLEKVIGLLQHYREKEEKYKMRAQAAQIEN